MTEVNASLAEIYFYKEKDMNMLSFQENLVHQLVMNNHLEKGSVANRVGQKSGIFLLGHILESLTYRRKFKGAHMVDLQLQYKLTK